MREGNGARAHIVRGRKELRAGVVDPFDQRRRRAEVAGELQVLELDAADALIAGAQEQPDFCVAELVDRLHRVADREQRAALAGFPAGSQRLQQVELRERGVLELVDQHVTQLKAGAQREIRRQPRLDQRLARRAGDIRVVDAPCGRELELQLAGRDAQNARQRFDGLAHRGH